MHDDLRLAFAERADELFGETGDPRFRAAAGVLRAVRVGRPPDDDSDALDYAHALLGAGLARSRDAALRRAAALYADGSVDSATRRMRGKWKKRFAS